MLIHILHKSFINILLPISYLFVLSYFIAYYISYTFLVVFQSTSYACNCILSSHNSAMLVATPKPSLTRSASPNRNPGTLEFFFFIFCVIKFSFSKMSRPESLARSEWRIRTGARFTPTFSFILSKHFIMSFRCGSGFSFGQAHIHLLIQCNSVGP